MRLVSRSVPADSGVVHEVRMMYEQCTESLRVPSKHSDAAQSFLQPTADEMLSEAECDLGIIAVPNKTVQIF